MGNNGSISLRFKTPCGRGLRFTFNGQAIEAFEGDSLAAALFAAGRRIWRWTNQRGEPRGLFCGMGVCFDCLMQVEGRGSVRACLTPVTDGMKVYSTHGPETAFPETAAPEKVAPQTVFREKTGSEIGGPSA